MHGYGREGEGKGEREGENEYKKEKYIVLGTLQKKKDRVVYISQHQSCLSVVPLSQESLKVISNEATELYNTSNTSKFASVMLF